MSEWKTATLQDVCSVITDGAHNSPKEVVGGFPMASVKDMTRHGIDLAAVKRISSEDFEKLKKQGCMPLRGDVLIAKDGNSALDTVCVHNLEEEIILLSSVAILRPNHEVCSGFLRYYLDAPQIRQMLKEGYRSGSAIPRVVLKDFRRAPIVYPPLREQQAIACVLGALDDKIELNRRRNRTLEAMARTIFQSWFVDFDPVKAKAAGRTPPGLSKEIAALFPDSFTDSPLGAIPTGWRVSSLAELMEIQGGTQPPANTFVDDAKPGYVRLVQIRDYETDAHLTYIQDSPKWRKCKAEDIMIARYGASVARICWGLEGAYNVALVKAVPATVEYREFLRSFLLSEYFQVRLIGMSNRSAQAGFNKGDIASFLIVSPPTVAAANYQAVAWNMRQACLHISPRQQ